jgi:polar amino acid transport system permease protein
MIGFRMPDIAFIPNFTRFASGIFAMSLNSAAYVAEIIRSGIQAVDKGQTEAARSLGFKSGQTMWMVVLPQAVKNILPALGNEFVTVIKESSIVSVIGIADLMFRTNDVIAVTYIQLESLAIAALIYFAMTFITSRLIALAERRMSNGNR